jgi:hypothetical protein
MKPKETMYQAITKVNVLSPVIFIIAEADAVHVCGRQHCPNRSRQEESSSVGVLGNGMVQDGIYVNLGDLYSSAFYTRQYAGTSRKGQGLAKDHTEVGLGGSTRSKVTPCTWGSAQQLRVGLNICSANPQRL